MARFRLRSAHWLLRRDHQTHAVANGDQENIHLGDEKGEIVGDGTPWVVDACTLEMIPLDAAAEAMIAAEEAQLANNRASMNPIDGLPSTVGRDDYDNRFVPGFPGMVRPQAKAPEPAKAKA